MLVDTTAWPGLELGASISQGHRNRVWMAQVNEVPVVVRESRRSIPSLAWELELNSFVNARGLLAPQVLLTADGEQHRNGVVVQSWLDGRAPNSVADWRLVSTVLEELHRLTAEYPQRPECCTVRELGDVRRSVDANLDLIPDETETSILRVFAEFDDVATAVIHGDPMGDNIRIDDSGRVGFLDWDESRVDLTWHDLSNLGVQVLDDESHQRAQRLSNAWEAANAWTVEPEYARRRLADLTAPQA